MQLINVSSVSCVLLVFKGVASNILLLADSVVDMYLASSVRKLFKKFAFEKTCLLSQFRIFTHILKQTLIKFQQFTVFALRSNFIIAV